MADRKDFVKIRTSVLLDRHHRITQEQFDTIYEEEEKMREKILLPLNDLVGLHTWAIQFSIRNVGEYFVDIYLSNRNDYELVVSTVSRLITDKKMTFWSMGTIDDYIGNRL